MLNDDTIIKQIFSNSVREPVISKQLQPWKNPDNTIEKLMADLSGCIHDFYNKYTFQLPNGIYDAHMLISDAYEGIMKSIERDKLAPTLPLSKIKCPHCSHVHTYTVPPDTASLTVMTDDSFVYATNAEANVISLDPKKIIHHRDFEIQCDNCHAQFSQRAYKSSFATCSFRQIQGAIEKGIKEAVNRPSKISKIAVLSLDSGNEDGFHGNIGVNVDVLNDDEKFDVSRIIYEEVGKMSLTKRRILKMMYGLDVNGHEDDCKPVWVDKGESEPGYWIHPNQTQIAFKIGISKQRVYMILDAIKKHLKEKLAKYVVN